MHVDPEIHSLADFQRRTAEFLAQLKATGHPLVLTIDDKAEIVVQDARSYQRLLDQVERLETIAAVKESLKSTDRGEGRPMPGVFDALENELRAKSGA